MIEFNQNVLIRDSEWDKLLLDFIRKYCVNFIKLELLMLFYRNRIDIVTPELIVSRTGYHPHEVRVNLDKLVSDRLLAVNGADTASPVYRRLEENDFAGRSLVWQILRRIVNEFNQRDGRLKIIYSLLKAQEKE